MTIDKQKLKALAQAVAELEDIPEREDEHAEAVDALWLNMHCHTILGLLAEIERLEDIVNEWRRSSPILPNRICADIIAHLKAENEALRKHIQEGIGLMPLGTAKRAAWVVSALGSAPHGQGGES